MAQLTLQPLQDQKSYEIIYTSKGLVTHSDILKYAELFNNLKIFKSVTW